MTIYERLSAQGVIVMRYSGHSWWLAVQPVHHGAVRAEVARRITSDPSVRHDFRHRGAGRVGERRRKLRASGFDLSGSTAYPYNDSPALERARPQPALRGGAR